MKLINRKTNEMACFGDGIVDLRKLGCRNVAEMIEAGWEDYKEPKPQVVYYIDRDGEVVSYKNVEYPKRVFNTEQNKEIGNYFETREEAKKAVRKLKAWKRLKDARFKFTDFEYDLEEESSSLISIGANVYFEMMAYEDFIDDLNLIFGDKQ